MDVFKANKVSAILILAGSLLAGCSATPGSPAAVYEQEQKKEEAVVEAVKSTVDELPAWYTKLPQDAHSVYAAGTGTSRNLQIAMDKGTLNAKRTLADRINGLLSSKMKEFASEVGQGEDPLVVSEFERVTTNLIIETNVAGYSQADAKVLSQGNIYRAYVLLQYPVGKANRLLLDQLKKSRVLKSKLRASKAFKELEEEIKRVRTAK